MSRLRCGFDGAAEAGEREFGQKSVEQIFVLEETTEAAGSQYDRGVLRKMLAGDVCGERPDGCGEFSVALHKPVQIEKNGASQLRADRRMIDC